MEWPQCAREHTCRDCRQAMVWSPLWLMGGRSDSVNGTSGVTSTADVPRRGAPLRLRAITGLAKPELTRSSFRVDPELLDDRPPFLGIGLHQSAERLRGLPLARKNVVSESDETRPHRWIGQCLDGRRIELADDVLRRAPGREKPEPGGVGKRWQSHLGKGRGVGCCRHARVACNRIGFYAPAAHQRQISGSVRIQVNLAGHQVLDSGGAATIGHQGKIPPDFFLKERGDEVRTNCGDAVDHLRKSRPVSTAQVFDVTFQSRAVLITARMTACWFPLGSTVVFQAAAASALPLRILPCRPSMPTDTGPAIVTRRTMRDWSP